MALTSYQGLLLTQLKKCGEYYQKDELAYLALTSKIELPFRDRLAYRLQRELEQLGDGRWVSREWKRFDLAILREREQPVALVELKAMYSFDMFQSRGLQLYPRLIASDQEKMDGARRKHAAVDDYILLLSTHPHDTPDPRYMDTVKYYRQIKAAKHRDPDAQAAVVQRHFLDHVTVAQDVIECGSAFGVEVSLYYWLMKAKAGA